MLKHASNASGAGSASATTTAAATTAVSTANGQLRNGSSNAPQQQQPRSIHLRPPQPLNISTLSTASVASNLQTSITSAAASAAATNAGHNGPTANGGQRIPTATLLNISHIGGGGVGGGGAGSTTATTTTPVTPISPIIPNGNAIGISSSLGIGNNLHTYTNQHITANNHNSNPHNTTATNNILNSTAISTATANNVNHNYSNCRNLVTTPTPLHAPLSATTLQQTLNKSTHGPGPREALTSLGLLCLVSLLLALLSLIFLLKISPNGREQSGARNSNEDFIIVYDVTLALCALSLSLNLCCLLVCAIQFLFAVKLLRSPMFNGRDNKYLEKSSISRTCAVGGFFISIPIFLTGIILYTLNHFHSTPAIITSVLIGIGIIFCGIAMVHNVFVWQKEKTISYRSPTLLNMSTITQQLQQLQTNHQQQQQQQHSFGPVTPPAQFLNSHNNHQNHYQQSINNNNNNNNATITSHYNTPNQCHSQQTLSPLQLLQQQQQLHHQQHQLHNQLSHHQHLHHQHAHAHGQHVSSGLALGPSMTPVSPNHSHGSFNPLLTGALGSSFLMRPATATPPTPKPPIVGGMTAAQSALARATSPHGSVSPNQGPNLDMSNITNASLHELSTLV